MVTNDRASTVRPTWSLRSRRWLIAGATLATLAALAAGATAYWQYVNFVPEFVLTVPALPNPNGYSTAGRIAASSPITHSPHGEKWWSASRPVLRSLVIPTVPAMVAMRHTFTLRWRAPPSLTEGFTSDVEVLRVPPPTTFADRFCAASRLARLEGRQAEALCWSIDAMELGNVNARGGNWDGAQTSEAQGMEQAERCVDAVPRAGLSEQLARVRRLRVTWPRATEALEIDRLEAHARLTDRLRGVSQKPLSQQLDDAEPVALGSSGISLRSPSGVMHHSWNAWANLLTPRTRSLAALDRHYELMKARARAPIRDGYGKAPLTDHWAEPFGSNMMGCYRWEWPRHNLALLETALAVRLFYLEHGRYPNSLDEIERKHLPEVPVDVWDQPLRYLLRNGRPVIYSIGRDGIDDGGRAVDPNTLVEHGTGDAVWGRLCDSDWPRKR